LGSVWKCWFFFRVKLLEWRRLVFSEITGMETPGIFWNYWNGDAWYFLELLEWRRLVLSENYWNGDAWYFLKLLEWRRLVFSEIAGMETPGIF
jgi:hypothetical protein